MEIFNRGYLDAKFSFTIALWIYPEGTSSGTIFSYQDGLELSVLNTNHLAAKFAFKRYKSETLTIFGIESGIWQYVGFSYDYMTGTARIWVGNVSMSKPLGEQKELATTKDIRLGASFANDTGYFKGRISDLRIYDYALSDKQVSSSKVKAKEGISQYYPPLCFTF